MANLTKKFPNDVEIQRMKTMKDYHHLYENRQRVVLPLNDVVSKQFSKAKETIYVAHAIPSKISDFYGDFVQGDVTRLRIYTNEGDEKDKKVQEIVQKNDLTEKIYDYAVNQSEFGYEILVGYIKDGVFTIQAVGKDQYFPQADGSAIFATYLRDPNRS